MTVTVTHTRPEVPLQVITPADVQASIRRAKKSLEAAATEIVWQIEMEAWRTLGYSSWGAMREAEYGGAAFMVPSKSRPEIVARIRAAGLTHREIGSTAGVSDETVRRDLQTTNVGSPATVTNVNGVERPATYTRTDPDDDVIDAEIVEDDEPIRVNTETGEVLNTPKATDPAPAESVTTTACPTCNGTGKVTR